MKFGTDIHSSQMMNLNNFDNPDFSFNAIMSFIFVVMSEMSQQLLDRFPSNFVKTFMVPQVMSPNDFSDCCSAATLMLTFVVLSGMSQQLLERLL